MKTNELNIRTINFLGRVGGIDRVKSLSFDEFMKVANKGNLGRRNAIELFNYLHGVKQSKNKKDEGKNRRSMG